MNAAISANKKNIIPPNSKEEILRIRIQGTWEDLEAFTKLLMMQSDIEVISNSERFLNKGTERIYRRFVDVMMIKTMRKELRGNRNGKSDSNRK